jgi:signal peptidase II
MPASAAAKKVLAFLPTLLSASLIAADQASKAWIVANVPDNSIYSRYFGDFLWIVHTRNLGIAFSIGDSIPAVLRVLLFIAVPICFLVAAAVYGYRSKALTLFQRFAIAFIVGGGLGNQVDRIFRTEGVVDFVSFSMYGLFGFDRFPTFNVADMSITIGAIALLISGFFMEGKEPIDDKRS